MKSNSDPVTQPCIEDLVVATLTSWWSLSDPDLTDRDHDRIELELDQSAHNIRQLPREELIRVYEVLGDIAIDLATTLSRVSGDRDLPQLVVAHGVTRGW